ncbi:hypothetical protein Glove_202g104 [Diversispora epigaea]|uniref:Uncharacterized protein n=1 Tax=Diversispora epigaea TaxID=1348612 RepID=A0A397IJY7_9GLOM|nr:hypothetical protein Glove_202g104 [Diversispora epigaea]
MPVYTEDLAKLRIGDLADKGEIPLTNFGFRTCYESKTSGLIRNKYHSVPPHSSCIRDSYTHYGFLCFGSAKMANINLDCLVIPDGVFIDVSRKKVILTIVSEETTYDIIEKKH